MIGLLAGAFAQTYNINDVTVAFPMRSRAEWIAWATGQATQKKTTIERRDPVTGDTLVLAPGSGFEALGDPALHGLWMAWMGYLPVGVEHDLMLPGPEGLRPVTVWVEAADRWVVSEGPAPAPTPEGRPMEALVAAYGLAGADGSFEPEVRAVIDLALGRLTPAERSALADVTLVRMSGAGPQTRGRWFNTAQFQTQTDHGRMVFFDDLLRPTGLFVGPVTAPHAPAAHTVLHEVAHAIDNAPLRAMLRAYNTESAGFNADVQASHAEYDALQKLRPAQRTEARIATYNAMTAALQARQAELDAVRTRIDAFRLTSAGFRAKFSPITEYGATSDEEAFAEAFALHHLDPDALARISPAASAWFASGGHLRGAR